MNREVLLLCTIEKGGRYYLKMKKDLVVILWNYIRGVGSASLRRNSLEEQSPVCVIIWEKKGIVGMFHTSYQDLYMKRNKSIAGSEHYYHWVKV